MKGFMSDFVGVGPPSAPAEAVGVFDYTHFSVCVCAGRGLAWWVAWNIDGGRLLRLPRSGLRFELDPRVPASAQHGDSLYSSNELDRGHLARRADVTWGSRAEASAANRDSFFFTNIAPQMASFNQSGKAGLWGRLEDAVYEDVSVDDLKVSAFAGPVFTTDDPLYRGVQIPRAFWKVLAYRVNDNLHSAAFLLTQELKGLDLTLDEFALYQVGVAELSTRTTLEFPAELTTTAVASTEAVQVDNQASIRWL